MRLRRQFFFINESRFTLFSQIIDVTFTNVVGNASLTLALSRGIYLGMVMLEEAFLIVYSQ